jgi:hypothetical protein
MASAAVMVWSASLGMFVGFGEGQDAVNGFSLSKAVVELKLVSKPPCDGIGGQKADMAGVAVDGHLGVVEADNVPQHRADRFVRPGYTDLPVLKDGEDPGRGHDLVRSRWMSATTALAGRRWGAHRNTCHG